MTAASRSRSFPLQLSSSLKFETISSEGQKLALTQRIINSDADHTGQLREAVVTLPKPLAPNSEQTLDVVYSGAIPASTKRLRRHGYPHRACPAIRLG